MHFLAAANRTQSGYLIPTYISMVHKEYLRIEGYPVSYQYM